MSKHESDKVELSCGFVWTEVILELFRKGWIIEKNGERKRIKRKSKDLIEEENGEINGNEENLIERNERNLES